MYYWPIYHFYVETRSLKKFISVNKLLFARHYHLVRPGSSLPQYYVRPPRKAARGASREKKKCFITENGAKRRLF